MTNEELIVLAKQGDDDAKEQLFIQNQDFIYKMAHKYKNIADFDDLVSLGNIGLAKAYNTFDETKGYKFITYYSRLVVNEMLMQFRKTKRKMKDVSIYKVLHKDSEGNELTIMDLKKDDNAEEFIADCENNEVLKLVINEFAKNEDKRLIDILRLRIIENKNQMDVSRITGVSQTQVSRLEKKIHDKLNKYYKKIS